MSAASRNYFNATAVPWYALLLICLSVLGGCAAPSKAAFLDPAMTVQGANQRIVPGQSTRADIIAALGPADVVTFDSGFEVWAYRSASPGAQRIDTELVILLDRNGLVKKTRLRLPGG